MRQYLSFMVRFMVLSVSVRLHVDASRRRCGVRFDYLSVTPRGRQDFDTDQDNC